MAVDVLLGLQWGDEGKGKIVDYLTEDYKMVCRFQGGPNAGHTLYINGIKVVLHTVPSGIFNPGVTNLIGNGVVIDPITLTAEIDELNGLGVDVKEQLVISQRAHLILPTHRWLDAASEASKGKQKIGSTLRGIGPAYMDKTGRNGLRIGDILNADFQEKLNRLIEKHKQLLTIYEIVPDFPLEVEMEKWLLAIERLRSFKIQSGVYLLNKTLAEGNHILAEGAQGSMLDIDFGTYPYVTSSNTISGGVSQGLGIPPTAIRKVFGITKAYCTRVGSGAFPTELFDDVGEKIMKVGGEFGATTGRPRRCGWLDLVQLRYSCMLNGVTDLIITKADVLSNFNPIKASHEYKINGTTTDELPLYLDMPGLVPQYKSFDGWPETNLESLPKNLDDYVQYIEKYLNIPVKMVSVGPERDAVVKR